MALINSSNQTLERNKTLKNYNTWTFMEIPVNLCLCAMFPIKNYLHFPKKKHEFHEKLHQLQKSETFFKKLPMNSLDSP